MVDLDKIPASRLRLLWGGPHIKVWFFEDAPENLRALSPHGGDEDWLALIPAALVERAQHIAWMDPGSSFGVYDVSVHKRPNGDEVRIGAHA